MAITVAELAEIKAREPRLHSVLKRIVEQVNLLEKSTGVAPAKQLPAPPTVGMIFVTASNGWFDISVQDSAVAQPGIMYFLEFDTSSNFANAHTEFMGPARHKHLGLGNQTLFFRAYSMYVGSGVRSPYVVLGGTRTPASVTGGGAAAPPLSPMQGSGTSQTAGYGFGTSAPGQRNSNLF